MTAEFESTITNDDKKILSSQMVGTPDLTREFLLISLTSGALQNTPQKVIEANWLTALDVTYRYFAGDETLEDIAAQYNVTREAIRGSIKRTIKKIWQNSPEEVKLDIPFEELDTRRHWGEYNALSLQSQIHELKMQGLTEDQILSQLDIQRDQLMASRRRYDHKYGISVPRADNKLWGRLTKRELAQQLVQAQSAEEIKPLLELVSIGFLDEYSEGDNPVLVRLKHIFRSNGPKGYEFLLQNLEQAGISVGVVEKHLSIRHKQRIQRYYFIAAQQLEQTQEVVENLKSQGILKNPVTQLAGPAVEQLPSSHSLMRSGNFNYLRPLLRELKIPCGGRYALHIDEYIDANCPVPLFTSGLSTFYKVEDRDTLANYLWQRAKEVKKR